MKRRECVLAVASTLPLVSGCAGVLTNSTDSEQRTTGTPERSDSTSHLSLSVESPLSAIDAQYELSLARGVTEEHPPQIRAVFTNTGDTEREFTFGSKAPLAPKPSDGPESKLQLRSPPADGYDADGCWRSTSDAWLTNATVATLPPGESISNTLDVLAAPEVDGERYCLPTGTFTFTESVSLFESTTRTEDDTTRSETTLRFTLTVE